MELEYYEPTYITSVSVYETYNPGALVKITATTASKDSSDVIFEGKPIPHLLPPKSRINTITVMDAKKVLQKKYKYLRLDMDTTKNSSWYEIDAVLMCGFIEKTRK